MNTRAKGENLGLSQINQDAWNSYTTQTVSLLKLYIRTTLFSIYIIKKLIPAYKYLALPYECVHIKTKSTLQTSWNYCKSVFTICGIQFTADTDAYAETVAITTQNIESFFMHVFHTTLHSPHHVQFTPSLSGIKSGWRLPAWKKSDQRMMDYFLSCVDEILYCINFINEFVSGKARHMAYTYVSKLLSVRCSVSALL